MATDYLKLGNELIALFLEEIKSDLIHLLDTENRNATGKAKASLAIDVNGLKGTLTGNNYIEYVFRGRGPGKMPPLSAIIDWCNAKGLPRGLAWVIAKRIAQFGTKLYRQGINYIDLAVDQKRIDAFIELLKDEFTTTIKADLLNQTTTV